MYSRTSSRRSTVQKYISRIPNVQNNLNVRKNAPTSIASTKSRCRKASERKTLSHQTKHMPSTRWSPPSPPWSASEAHRAYESLDQAIRDGTARTGPRPCHYIMSTLCGCSLLNTAIIVLTPTAYSICVLPYTAAYSM